MAEIVQAPNDYILDDRFSVFLAGSIEMGAAENWQERVTESLMAIPDLVILNPRRDDWDSSWEQSIDNPQFRVQVEWELKAQEAADMIVMYFSPGTKSPITLLELGLFRDMDVVVCCPEGFWRKGNVDIVCKYFGIVQVGTLEDMIQFVKGRARRWGTSA